jgi:hypothetical protein
MRRGGKYKSNPKHGGGGHGGGGSSKSSGRRRRRRNPGTTFVQALGRVVGAAAAMFGTGVLVTLGTAKIAPGHPASLYGIPAVTALLGAGIATKMPLVGAGVAAGAAAPFVLPVASTLLGGGTTGVPSTSTVSALRAVAMGGSYRELNAYPRMNGVSNPLGSVRGVPNPIGAVRMGTVYAG